MRSLIHPEWQYLLKYEPFRRIGSDVFLTVHPTKLQIFVADAKTIVETATRGSDFPKSKLAYRTVSLYGPNLATVEGQEWKRMRKLVTPIMENSNHKLVWSETLHHTQCILHEWLGSKSNAIVRSPAADCSQLALNVLSVTAFGIRLPWQRTDNEPFRRSSDVEASPLAPGHTLNFGSALIHMLNLIIWPAYLPLWLLKLSPWENPRLAGTAYREWGMYMDKLLMSKVMQMQNGENGNGSQDDMDLHGRLVKASEYMHDDKQSKKSQENPSLSLHEMMGSAYLFFMAGFETNANAMHFSLIHLALRPELQKQLQREYDNILQGRSISEWNFERDIAPMMNGLPAAVMNESLRFTPPLLALPKQTRAGEHQRLTTSDGESFTVPPSCRVSLSQGGVHNNPKYWPCVPDPSTGATTYDLLEWKPERWLTPDGLFHPPRGAYLAFGEGARSCPGKKFAHTEVLAALAVIMQGHSVELAVEELLDEEELAVKKTGSTLLERGAEKARKILREGMSTMITLQLRGDEIPLRIVKRGEERF